MFWRKFPNRKPKKSGRYLCTICRPTYKCDPLGEMLYQTFVMVLYWDDKNERFIDLARQAVFTKYTVFSTSELTELLQSDDLVDRTEVVSSWKRIPRPKKEFEKMYFDGDPTKLMYR